MTKLSTVLLASLPSTLAAMLAYTPTDEMRAMAASRADCNLPGYYNINNFLAQSNDTGRTLSAFDFGFANNETQVTTLCHFNASSDSTTPPGATPRYFCEDKNVLFIWENEDQKLWMIQQVCPGPSG
jgi:hypothetical protein